MMYLITINIIIIIISLLMMKINFLLNKKKMKMRNKLSSFECGFDNISMMRLPFSINFFMISLIFLIFDIEISLIFPMIKNFLKTNNLLNDPFMIIMIILIIGLYYEWKEGSLKWLK